MADAWDSRFLEQDKNEGSIIFSQIIDLLRAEIENFGCKIWVPSKAIDEKQHEQKKKCKLIVSFDKINVYC